MPYIVLVLPGYHLRLRTCHAIAFIPVIFKKIALMEQRNVCMNPKQYDYATIIAVCTPDPFHAGWPSYHVNYLKVRIA
jgi:hypothetical protein